MPRIKFLLLFICLFGFMIKTSSFADELNQNNFTYQVCITPKQSYKECTALVQKFISTAKKRIIIQGDVFFTQLFIKDLFAAQQRGVTIYKVGLKPNLKQEYFYEKQFQPSGTLALELAGQHSAHTNLLIIDDKQLLITSFSLFSSLNKFAIDHVLEITNQRLAKHYMHTWKRLLQKLPEKKLKKIAENPYSIFVIPQSRKGNYYSYGKLNGVEVRFLIDTGATISVVPINVANVLKLKSNGTLNVTTAAGKRKLQLSKVNSIKLGPINIKNMKIAINPHVHSGIVLLGMNFLRKLDFYIHQGNLYLIQRYQH